MNDNAITDYEIKTNSSYVPIKLGFVNCYLVRNGDDFILIDTGFRRKRKDLEHELVAILQGLIRKSKNELIPNVLRFNHKFSF